MLLLCVIFHVLEVIDRFITSSFVDAVTKVVVSRMRKLENCVGGGLDNSCILQDSRF